MRPRRLKPKGPTLKLTVSDLVVRTREVEVPTRCPKCNNDLTVPEGLSVAYPELRYTGSEVKNGEVLASNVTYVSSFDADIACVYAACGECSEPLMETHHRVVTPHKEVTLPQHKPKKVEAVRRIAFITRKGPSPEEIVVKVNGENRLHLTLEEARSLLEGLSHEVVDWSEELDQWVFSKEREHNDSGECQCNQCQLKST